MSQYHTSYEQAKEAFLNLTHKLPSHYELTHHPYTIFDDLTMDVFDLKPKKYHHLLCISSGLHGIEGYVGNYMIQVFVEEILKHIRDTRILLIHGINPYGMKYYRKVNEENVDLNRNFIVGSRPENKGFEASKSLFLPKKLSKFYPWATASFYFDAIKTLIKTSQDSIREGALKGQYHYEKGFFYGGQKDSRSTRILKSIYDICMSESYENRLFIDLHTGYGPSHQMSIVNSRLEKRNLDWMKRQFNYPLIQASDGQDFYSIDGDMIDYLNQMIHASDYATCFEFGTIGEHLLAQLKSLRIMVHESCLYYYPNESIQKKLIKDFKGLYMPNNEKWLNKAEKDFEKAIKGILKAFELYSDN